jgi:hypothetical protein
MFEVAHFQLQKSQTINHQCCSSAPYRLEFHLGRNRSGF